MKKTFIDNIRASKSAFEVKGFHYTSAAIFAFLIEDWGNASITGEDFFQLLKEDYRNSSNLKSKISEFKKIKTITRDWWDKKRTGANLMISVKGDQELKFAQGEASLCIKDGAKIRIRIIDDFLYIVQATEGKIYGKKVANFDLVDVSIKSRGYSPMKFKYPVLGGTFSIDLELSKNW